MKRVTLLVLAVIQIFLSVAIFFIGREYAFTEKSTNTWLPCLVIGLLFLGIFSLSKQNVINKIPNLLLIVYPAGLALISFIVSTNLPNYTYLEAREIVIKDTDEKIDDSKNGEQKGQLGMYFIYTEDNVYIFNSEDGSYAKRNVLD